MIFHGFIRMISKPCGKSFCMRRKVLNCIFSWARLSTIPDTSHKQLSSTLILVPCQVSKFKLVVSANQRTSVNRNLISVKAPVLMLRIIPRGGYSFGALYDYFFLRRRQIQSQYSASYAASLSLMSKKRGWAVGGELVSPSFWWNNMRGDDKMS